MSVDNSATNIGEEFFDETTDSVPIAKGVWRIAVKCLSKGKIRAILEDGQDELHGAGEILYDVDAKAALERVEEFENLLDQHAGLEEQSTALEKLLNDTTFWQFCRKFDIRVQVIEFKKASARHKRLVRAKSDRARLGLNPHDGTRVGAAGATALGMRTEETLVAGAHRGEWFVESRSETPAWASPSTHRVDDSEDIAETHSIFGNPWHGYGRVEPSDA
ncbi:hypothetical protein OH77DRAFT_1420992 [Trametes cingulata]|nr:hypothetical protein OH77DRAFT_1420992 [Trametes cingulata]